MTQEEKEIYSLIFKAALKLSQNREYVEFAVNMLKAIDGDASGEAYSFCWDFLKEYAGIKNTLENEKRWEEIVDRAEEYGKTVKFQRVMMACMLKELERRGKRGLE